ncbi:hypothetical protein BDQ17DRAFT_1342118 [Cyathus striatus]|nr:hypothetical protein BDQ17DRAFT_1342118 [Cyathus striatus]
MIHRPTILFILYVALGNAQTSLYVPGFEPQPVSADNIGVGSDGRTTWVIHEGEATDTSSYSYFVGTVYHWTEVSFSQSLAICTAEMDGSTAVYTEVTEVASLVPIQTGLTNYTFSATSLSSSSLSTSGTTRTLPSPSAPANSSVPLKASNLVIAATFTTIFFLLSYQAI